MSKFIASIFIAIAGLFGVDLQRVQSPAPTPIIVVVSPSSTPIPTPEVTLTPTPTPKPIKKTVPGATSKPIPVPAPSQTPLPTFLPTPLPTIDPALKIAQCQASARKQTDDNITRVLTAKLPEFQSQLDATHANYLAAKQEQVDCWLAPLPPDMIGMSPEMITTYHQSCANTKQVTVNYYSNLENQIADLWEQAKQAVRRTGEQQYNSDYLACLNS
ncbi:MAG: hypothetical protein Q7S09_05640 [bacterium]|nr:hypothetical protein [bacterium]